MLPDVWIALVGLFLLPVFVLLGLFIDKERGADQGANRYRPAAIALVSAFSAALLLGFLSYKRLLPRLGGTPRLVLLGACIAVGLASAVAQVVVSVLEHDARMYVFKANMWLLAAVDVLVIVHRLVGVGRKCDPADEGGVRALDEFFLHPSPSHSHPAIGRRLRGDSLGVP